MARAPLAWTGDVIVVGGGPAGSACAALLGRAGLSVLVVEQGPSRRWQPVEVLAPATVQLLRQHRLFDVDSSRGYGTCRGVHGLWGEQPAFLDYQLFACDAGVAVNRDDFDRELLARAAADGARILSETTVERAWQAPDGTWTVSLVAGDGQGTASAAVLIDAGGRAARSLGATGTTRQYFDRLVGIACPMRLEPSQIQIMLLEADAEGWWYSSCDARGDGAAVFLSDADLVPKAPEARADFFRRRFESSRFLRHHLPGLPGALDLRVIDARTSRRTRFSSRAALSIGDAAYGVDPLSGSGIRRAVEGAIAAAEAVQAFLTSRDGQALDRYDGWATTEFERWLGDRHAVYAEASPELHDHAFWARRISRPGV